MLELYYRADEDNKFNIKLCYDVYEKDNRLVVDFVQFERSGLNKWNMPEVLTDARVVRYILPEIKSSVSFKEKLVSFIEDRFDESLSVMNEIGDLAKTNHTIFISLPTSIYPLKRGMPTDKTFKNTFLPLIVSVDGKDVSTDFIDFGDYGPMAVNKAYDALIKGTMPESENDIFNIDGVKSLHDELGD